MILLDHVVEVIALTQPDPPRNNPSVFNVSTAAG
jgi:hypothetical protein